MAVYSKLLAARVVAGGSDALVYTAPALGTVVVRDVVVCATTTTGTDVSLYGTSPGGVSTTIWHISVAGTGATLHYDCRVVLEPGERLYVYAPSGAVQVRISGYLLGG